MYNNALQLKYAKLTYRLTKPGDLNYNFYRKGHRFIVKGKG